MKLLNRPARLGLAILAGVALTVGQPQPEPGQRANSGIRNTGNTIAAGATRYHVLAGGALSGWEGLAAFMANVERVRPSNPDEVRALLRSMKIDGGMPNRISMNASIRRQTQGATFGERGSTAPPRTSAGGGAASAAYAATSRAPEEVVIILCDDAEQEQEALGLIPLQVENAPTKGDRISSKIQDEPRSFTSLVRRVGAPGGRQWSWLSGNVLP